MGFSEDAGLVLNLLRNTSTERRHSLDTEHQGLRVQLQSCHRQNAGHFILGGVAILVVYIQAVW